MDNFKRKNKIGSKRRTNYINFNILRKYCEKFPSFIANMSHNIFVNSFVSEHSQLFKKFNIKQMQSTQIE